MKAAVRQDKVERIAGGAFKTAIACPHRCLAPAARRWVSQITTWLLSPPAQDIPTRCGVQKC